MKKVMYDVNGLEFVYDMKKELIFITTEGGYSQECLEVEEFDSIIKRFQDLKSLKDDDAINENCVFEYSK